jgi:NADPH-dependent curcumin reductase CurA
MARTGREIQLAARPVGEPKPSDFRLVDVEVPEPAAGQVLVRNTFMSVDPYMRGRMNDGPSYVAPFQLDEPLSGGAIGEVVASTVDAIPVGATVSHGLGWRDFALLGADEVRVVDAEANVATDYLGVLGGTGFTAYVGLLDVGGLREGDVVFVSGAAGAVGMVVGQIAKLLGHTVIGSAGTAEKVAFLQEELGFDAAFNYRDGRVADLLAQAAPDGIDLYFDNVGGEHLEAAIGALNPHGRAALCGGISGYSATEPPAGPRNMMLIVTRRLTLRGFILTDHLGERERFETAVGGWLREGRIKRRDTVVAGLENAPDAFMGMLRGANTGKALVEIG